jgi:anti-sigma-K factor RskA
MLDAMVETDADAPLRRPRDRGRVLHPWRRFVIAAVIVLGVLGLTVGTVAIIHLTNPLTILSSADDVRQTTERVEGGGTATVSWSPSLAQVSVTPSGLGPLPAHFVYQVWLLGAEDRPAGILSGDDTVLLDARLLPGDEVAITIEPEGGSAVPTTDPILLVPTTP